MDTIRRLSRWRSQKTTMPGGTRRWNRLLLIVGLSALAVFFLQVATYILPLQLASSATDPASASGVTASSTVASRPLILSIPKIGVSARIESVGTNKMGQMRAPSSFRTVAWYMYGAKPGSNGAAVIVGHVDNALALKGVFFHLSALAPGDDLQVQDSKGVIHRFVVVRIASYAYDDATPLQEIFVGSATSSELNLITCGGTWIPSIHSYDKRVVVYTRAY